MATLPTINMNGTARQDLIDQQLDVVNALSQVLDALAKARPNGRDYPTGTDALMAALREHRTLADRIETLRTQVENKAMRIAGFEP
jgi:hypothetical protein